MQHRLVNNGFGSNAPILLNNKGTVNKEFADDAIETYFKDYEGFDFQLQADSIAIGIEPTYQSDPLRIISINKDKSKSFIQTGRAWGPYGSGIASTTKTYSSYKYNSKFKRFIDKWHGVLFP